MPLNRSLVEEEAPGTNIATGASKTDKDVTADVDVDNGDCIDDEDENSENDGGKEDDEDGEDGDCFAKFDDKSVKLEDSCREPHTACIYLRVGPCPNRRQGQGRRRQRALLVSRVWTQQPEGFGRRVVQRLDSCEQNLPIFATLLSHGSRLGSVISTTTTTTTTKDR